MPIAVRELLGAVTMAAESGDDIAAQTTIWIIAGTLLGIYAVRVAAQALSHIYGGKFGLYLCAQIRYKLYSHLQTLPPKFYQDKQVGRIVARLMQDIDKIWDFIAFYFPDFIIGVLTVTGVIIVLFVINPVLAVLVIAPLPILLFTSVLYRKMARRHFVREKKAIGATYGILTDNLQGMKEIQMFGKQEYELNRVIQKNEQSVTHATRGIRWMAFQRSIPEFIQGVGTIIVIVTGGFFAMRGNLAIADIVAFMLFIGLLYTPIASMARTIQKATDALTSAERAFEYLDHQSEVKDRPNAINVGTLRGELEFKNVTFGYNDQVILNDFSFHAAAGSMVALVGQTGAGKTTVASLIGRFYDIQGSGTDGLEGASVQCSSITIDGIDIRDMTLQSLRDNLSVVLQDVFLFNGTIMENIRYGRNDDVPQEEIEAAARAACIHDFINGLPEKYNTQIGERGVRLSGGQKQRLAIARAILRNSPILILDEATSSIDNTTEREIQAAIDALSRDKSRTIIVIAHRLSTIEKADKILFIENGQVIEQGTHAELLKNGKAYRQLRQSMNIGEC